MLSLSLGSHHGVREGQHGHLFWRSVRKSIYLHIRSPRMFDVDQWFHFALPASVPREAHDDLVEGMKEARVAWLRHAPSMLLSHQSYELRNVLGKSDNIFHMNRMDNHQVAKALYNEVKDGNLLFVPEKDDMRKCVEAIRKQREKAFRLVPARTQQPADADITRVLYGNGPHVPQNLDTPSYYSPIVGALSDAQPFDYRPAMPDGNAEELAASTNNPNYAAKMLGYDRKTFGDILHKFKPRNGLGPADNVIWHDNGDVYFKGNYVGNFHDWAD
ncbi:hypothetical protein [Paraburkholderia susongensis]|uniref:Uncharacterized protein n=1 Tax=Paraburkholderia susongensis TaxID=1515439 RepID=A0A1X7M7K8_9BURK|nr:hypothetical protein [Paraburkholderia susongensis]SMG61432.1 hypothetical protein SAMN06265784_1226 [Paraburkholderia susongensis]